MATDIFIKTYGADAEYHAYCLKSIDKFCTGFRSTRVINDEHPHGYLWQQAVKMEADRLTFQGGDSPEDFFLMTDSDTLFTMPVTPEAYLRDGKPIWIHTPWTKEMLDHAGTATWKRIMTEFFGVEPPSEFMRRQGFMFPRYVLRTLRDFCEKTHGVSLGEYIMRSKAFSEYNILGFHCWLHHREVFHWIDSSTDELPEITLRQFWSHDRPETNIEEINQILS